jgi:hypothetical protein
MIAAARRWHVTCSVCRRRISRPKSQEQIVKKLVIAVFVAAALPAFALPLRGPVIKHDFRAMRAAMDSPRSDARSDRAAAARPTSTESRVKAGTSQTAQKAGDPR